MENGKKITANQLSETFYALFRGREESCAIKVTTAQGKTYMPYRDKSGRDIPFNPDLCIKHMTGELSLGVYPLDKDNCVYWAAVDFDGKKGNALEDAVKVKNSLETKLGLICWMERSQSGNGIHLWIFFEEKVKAVEIRALLRNHIEEFLVPPEKRKTSYDRVFPNQDFSSGYGNLCALPLNGKDLVSKGRTAFIDDSGEPLAEQSILLLKIYESRNKTELLQEHLKTLPSIPTERKSLPVLNAVPGGTKLMAPQGCAWLRNAFKRAENLSEPEWYAAIGQFAKVEQGDILAHRFSSPYKGYSEPETQKKFEHAKEENKPMTCQTIWDRFGDCGKRCAHLGVNHPWEIAKVPLYKLDEGNKGKVYTSTETAVAGINVVEEILSGKRVGVPWGYDLLDDHTEIRPRNLIVVAARQGIGKTAAMIDVSVNGAERKIPQYIFSMEMGYEELALRYLARISGISQTAIVTGRLSSEEIKALHDAAEVFKTLPIFIDDSTSELDRMLDNVGELTYKNGRGVIWIDYLQLVRKKQGENKKEAVDRVVAGYKLMSKIVDSPVITLAQLNRSEEFAEGDDDLDSWLKDSGDIEQTADVIHYLRGQKGPGVIERRWRLHKERHRESGINFKFMLHQGIFKFQPEGYWAKRSVTEDDLGGLEPGRDAFAGI